MTPIIRKAELADIVMHVADLSKEDAAEQMTLGRNQVDSLAYELDKPGKSYTWVIDNRPVMMFGVNSNSVLSGTGWIWLSVTEEAKRHTVTMLRNWRGFLAEMEGGYQKLETTIHASLVTTLKWIERAGFVISAPGHLHGSDEMFHYCYKECA